MVMMMMMMITAITIVMILIYCFMCASLCLSEHNCAIAAFSYYLSNDGIREELNSLGRSIELLM